VTTRPTKVANTGILCAELAEDLDGATQRTLRPVRRVA
jgi:hypothetical protein